MRILPHSAYPDTGECVKCGLYSCLYCDSNNPYTFTVTKETEELPQCPVCQTDVEWFPVSVVE